MPHAVEAQSHNHWTAREVHCKVLKQWGPMLVHPPSMHLRAESMRRAPSPPELCRAPLSVVALIMGPRRLPPTVQHTLSFKTSKSSSSEQNTNNTKSEAGRDAEQLRLLYAAKETPCCLSRSLLEPHTSGL